MDLDDLLSGKNEVVMQTKQQLTVGLAIIGRPKLAILDITFYRPRCGGAKQFMNVLHLLA